MRDSGFFLRRCGLVLAVASCAIAAAPARAQDAAPLPGVVAPPAAVPAPPVNRVVLPAEKSADIQTHWNQRRDYLRDRDERRADDEEQHVRLLKDDLGIENLFSIGSALVRESQEALAAGSPAQALIRCKLAIEFAPALPEAHTCLARALLTDSPLNVKLAFGELIEAGSRSLDDPRSSRALLANALGVLICGLILAGGVFVAVLFARYAQLYMHDVHHLFPLGARRWQTQLLAVVLILAPIFLQLGPIPLIFTVLFACALYATAVEAAVSCILLGLLAASPMAAEGLARIAAFGGPAVDAWLLEHGEGSAPELQRLQKRFESGGTEVAVSYSLARKAKRDGDLATADTLYRKALETPGAPTVALAALHNNLGNVYLLQGDTAKAMAQYQQSIDLRESQAAPHFNISRALGLGGVETLEKVQSEMARAQELDRGLIESFTGGQLQASRKANKFVLDTPLDDDLLEPLRYAEARAAGPVGDEVRAQLAGPLPGDAAWALPLVAAAIFLGLHLAKGKVKPSGRCERCGREVCKRCDPDARPSESLCAQCVNVFIRRTGVDAAERIRKEHAVQRYHRRRETTARVLGVLSGAGHVLIGYPLRGIFFLLLTSMLLASVLLWAGLLHDPVAVRSGISPLRVGLTLAALVAVYSLCLRDLIARQRAEGA